MMRCLFLDLASHKGLLACVTKETVVASAPVDHRIDDAELVVRVENILKDAGWTYQDLTHLACVVGPGGFTSLRVAVTCVNTLSYALHLPSGGVHVSEVYGARVVGARHAVPLQEGTDVWWLHSTKKKELFVRGFGRFAEDVPEPRLVELGSLDVYIKEGSSWMGELIPEHREIAERLGAREAALRSMDEVLPAFLSAQDYHEQTLQPWYGRGW